MPINKVIYGNSTLLDLTSDTVSESNVASGKTFHRKDGTKVTGTAEMAQASYSNQTITLTNGFPVSVGGGGVDVTPLSVTENGTYTAPSGTAYTPVTVAVPQPGGEIDITTNGIKNVAAYATANVRVPASAVDTGTKDITENGTHDVVGFANVNVNVASGGGKAIQYSPVITQLKNKTTYTKTNSKITVEESGTYKCTWVHWASLEQNTHATQLYRNDSAVGSAHASPIYSNATGTNFVATENNIALTAGQTIEVRARTRSGGSYYTTAGMLVIEKI